MSRFSSFSGTKGRDRQRPLLAMLLGVAALVVLPAAVAFACLPKAAIDFDKQDYRYNAGDTVTVKGFQLSPKSAVVMNLQAPSGQVSTVGTEGTTTDDTGAFTDSFGLASDAATGDYVVSAKAGTRSASQTFTVEPPASSPPPINPFAPTPTPTPSPVEVAPTEAPQTGNNTRALRAKAVRNCKKKFSSNRARTSAAKRSMAKKRAACVRKARKRYP